MAVIPYDQNIASRAVIASMSSTASDSVQVFEDINNSASNTYDLPQKIRVSSRDLKLVLVAVGSDDEPNDYLKQAAKAFKEKYG